MRAHWALHELSLPYETNRILSRSGETQTAEYTVINPRQEIPLLQDDDISVAESGAIVLYLAEIYGERNPQLIPAGKRDRARWLEWNSFITMELDAISLYVVRRHSLLSHICGEAPAAVESSRAYFTKQIAYVDQTLCNTQYLMGDNFTTADILLTTCLTWATALQIPVPGRCRAYVERVTARDAYKSALPRMHAKIPERAGPLARFPPGRCREQSPQRAVVQRDRITLAFHRKL